RRMTVAEVPVTPAVLVLAEDPAQRLIDLAAQFAVTDFVVADSDQRYAGMVVGDDVRTTLVQREAVPLMIVGEGTNEIQRNVIAAQLVARGGI
ncbi:MAG: hypothetical protein ACPGIJ_09915, partial [Mycobacterium sp.]